MQAFSWIESWLPHGNGLSLGLAILAALLSCFVSLKTKDDKAKTRGIILTLLIGCYAAYNGYEIKKDDDIRNAAEKRSQQQMQQLIAQANTANSDAASATRQNPPTPTPAKKVRSAIEESSENGSTPLRTPPAANTNASPDEIASKVASILNRRTLKPKILSDAVRFSFQEGSSQPSIAKVRYKNVGDADTRVNSWWELDFRYSREVHAYGQAAFEDMLFNRLPPPNEIMLRGQAYDLPAGQSSIITINGPVLKPQDLFAMKSGSGSLYVYGRIVWAYQGENYVTEVCYNQEINADPHLCTGHNRTQADVATP